MFSKITCSTHHPSKHATPFGSRPESSPDFPALSFPLLIACCGHTTLPSTLNRVLSLRLRIPLRAATPDLTFSTGSRMMWFSINLHVTHFITCECAKSKCTRYARGATFIFSSTFIESVRSPFDTSTRRALEVCVRQHKCVYFSADKH